MHLPPRRWPARQYPNHHTSHERMLNQQRNSYGHAFALVGIVASLSSILILAVLCQYTSKTDGLVHQVENNVNRHEHRRSLQQWNHSELYHEIRSSYADLKSNSSLPCEDIFKSAPFDAYSDKNERYIYLCQYAQNCDGDWPSSALLPLILCHGVEIDVNAAADYTGTKASDFFQTSFFLYFALPPIILCYLYLLFRLLATTADSYFSPALETFSFEMGLPPRFAGAVSCSCSLPCVLYVTAFDCILMPCIKFMKSFV